MTRKPYEAGRIFVGRLPKGADLMAAITKIANEEGVKLGAVSAHGLLERLSISRHNLETRMNEVAEYDGPAEIAALSGTISQFKGRSMARLNGVVVAGDGSLLGGVIALGTVVHACEVVITELLGGTLTRDFDMETGLALWKPTALLVDP